MFIFEWFLFYDLPISVWKNISYATICIKIFQKFYQMIFHIINNTVGENKLHKLKNIATSHFLKISFFDVMKQEL